MYLVREVFKTKPGKAKELVKMFKKAMPFFEQAGDMKNSKLMTDAVGPYWTVVFQAEVEELGKFFGSLRSAPGSPELAEIMKGYLDLLEGGNREIYLIE